MAITDRFPTWGDTGEQPSSGFQYSGGDQVNEKHLDYLWDALHKFQEDIKSEFNSLVSDADFNDHSARHEQGGADTVDATNLTNIGTVKENARTDNTTALRVETRTSDPSSPADGRDWIRTDL